MHQLGNLLGAIGVAPLVLANAFATYANDGNYCVPIAILTVTDSTGESFRPRPASAATPSSPRWPGA